MTPVEPRPPMCTCIQTMQGCKVHDPRCPECGHKHAPPEAWPTCGFAVSETEYEVAMCDCAFIEAKPVPPTPKEER